MCCFFPDEFSFQINVSQQNKINLTLLGNHDRLMLSPNRTNFLTYHLNHLSNISFWGNSSVNKGNKTEKSV